MSGLYGRRLTRSDYAGSTPDLARRLLDTVLVHEGPEGLSAGRIVETEAYLSEDDGASHSAPGPTRRNAAMFLGRGHAYVYLCYGVHMCFNVVSAEVGRGEAVLIRALEPLLGLDLMARRRGGKAAVTRPAIARKLCSGPGKLAQALGIVAELDKRDLCRGSLRLHHVLVGERAQRVAVGPRIGISRAVDLQLRFKLSGSPWLSRS